MIVVTKRKDQNKLKAFSRLCPSLLTLKNIPCILLYPLSLPPYELAYDKKRVIRKKKKKSNESATSLLHPSPFNKFTRNLKRIFLVKTFRVNKHGEEAVKYVLSNSLSALSFISYPQKKSTRV